MKLRKKIDLAFFIFFIIVSLLFSIIIFTIGKNSNTNSFIVLIEIELALLILVLIMIFFLKKTILRRLDYLKNEIDNIIINEDLNLRVKDSGKDEIREIFKSFNKLLSIIEIKSIEKEKKELRYKALFDIMFSGSFYCKIEKFEEDYKVILIDINDSYLYNLGYTREQFNKISKNIDPIKYLDFNKDWKEYFEKAAFSGEYFKIEDYYSELSKEWYNVYIYSNEEGYFNVIYDNVTEKKKAINDKIKLSNFDTLTNLPNRGLINKKLEDIMISARLEGNKIGILFMDLVNFKSINDTFGHSHGDQVLKEVGKRISNCLLPSEYIGRFGGDEFVIFKEDYKDKEELEELAERIISNANKEIIYEGRQYFVDISIGICLYDGIKDKEYNFETLLKNADIAMYNAKKIGGSSYKFYEDKMDSKNKKDIFVSGKLKP